MNKKRKKSTNKVTFKRSKSGVEITGYAKDVKWHIYFEQIIKASPIFLILFESMKGSWIKLLWQWIIKGAPFLTLFLVQLGFYLILFSG